MRRSLSALLPFFVCAATLSCGSAAPPPRRAPAGWPHRANDGLATPRSAAAVTFAYAQVGKRYCWGGAGPECFDCSGLVQSAWRRGGVLLPRTSDAQGRALLEVDPSDVRPGDILWWPGHVGLYVGGGAMIDAYQSSTGVVRRPAAYPERVLRVPL